MGTQTHMAQIVPLNDVGDEVNPDQFRKVYIRLHEKGNSNSNGARRCTKILSMIKWIRTSRLSMKTCLSFRTSLVVKRRGVSRASSSFFLRVTKKNNKSLAAMIDTTWSRRVPREQKMLKELPPRVTYHAVY